MSAAVTKTSDASTDRLGDDDEPVADPYDHHRARSSAATRFDPSDVDDPKKQRKYKYLKRWNDGIYDSERQKFEGRMDKQQWAESFGAKLSLPRDVIGEAQLLLDDLDIRQLGHFNDLHVAVLGALTQVYQRYWLRREYRTTDNEDAKRWCERSDFETLWTSLELTEDQLRSVARDIGEKTSD